MELLSGVFEGRTTGCPIGFVVRNEQQHSADYDNLRELFRPSHADFTYQMKYGVRDTEEEGEVRRAKPSAEWWVEPLPTPTGRFGCGHQGMDPASGTGGARS